MEPWVAISFLRARQKGLTGARAARAAIIGQLAGPESPAVSVLIADRISDQESQDDQSEGDGAQTDGDSGSLQDLQAQLRESRKKLADCRKELRDLKAKLDHDAAGPAAAPV